MSNEKDRAFVLLNRLWRDLEGGAYGPRASIDPRWSRNKSGYRAFKGWFDKQPLVSPLVITKDWIRQSDVFGPETTLLVPRALHEWIAENFISNRVIPTSDVGPFRVILRYRKNEKRLSFDTKEEAETFVREQAEQQIALFDPQMSKIYPGYLPRLMEMVEIGLSGLAPYHFYSRDDRKKHQINPNRQSKRFTL